jgi:hypothetical protein
MGSAAKPLGAAIATITPGWSAIRKLGNPAREIDSVAGIRLVGSCQQGSCQTIALERYWCGRECPSDLSSANEWHPFLRGT